MNKTFLLGMFAAAGMLFATSCSNDDLIEQTTGDTATVSFTVNTESAVASRAISDGSGATELVYQVYRVDGDVYKSTGQMQTTNGFSSGDNVSLKLAKGQEYAVAFWAQSPDAPYELVSDAEGLKVHMKYDVNTVNNTENRDAFFGCEKLIVSGNETKTVTLKRPFAQVNVGASDYDDRHAQIVSSSVTISNVATTLNLMDGSVEGETSVTFDMWKGDLYAAETVAKPTQTLTVNGKDYTWLSMCYVLPTDKEQSTTVSSRFEFEVTDGTNIVLEDGLSNMPIQRNYRTNIIGNLLTNNVDFNIVIDADFQGDIWDNTVSNNFTEDENGVYHIQSSADFALLMEQTQDANSPYAGATFVLDTDISFGGKTIKGVGSDQCNIPFTFDGNNHTISDFVIDNNRKWYAGLFNQVSHGGCVKNLTVKNATVTGQRMVGAIASNVENGCVIENCHVENCIVVANQKKAGAVVGYAVGATVKSCSAKNVNVYCADAAENESGEIVGYYVNSDSTITDNIQEKVTVVRGTKCTVVSSMSELEAALPVRVGDAYVEGGIIVLSKNIDMTGWTSVNGTYTNFTLEGNGYSLKNLTTPLYQHLGVGTYEVRNLNFDNANINRPAIDGSVNGFAGVLVSEMTNNGGTTLTIDNCNVNNSKIYGWKYAGGFIGFTNNGQGGKVADITISNSNVNNTEISTEDSSCGGFVGHTSSQTLNIKDCKIKGTSSVECTEDRNGEAAKAGYLVGTVNGGTTTITSCEVIPTVTLTNNNAGSTVENGWVGRNVGGTVVKN